MQDGISFLKNLIEVEGWDNRPWSVIATSERERSHAVLIEGIISQRLKANPVEGIRVGSSSAEPVASSVMTPGGIDFDPTNMNLQIKRNGKGVPLPLPQQNLEQINIQGLFPVIINIIPVNAQTLPRPFSCFS